MINRSHVEQVQKVLNQNALDALLLTSRENKYYTAGLYSGSGFVMVLTNDCYVIVDGRYYVQQKSQTEAGKTLLINKDCTAWDHVNQIAQKKNIDKLGFEQEDVSFACYQAMKAVVFPELVPVSMGSARMKKDEREMNAIRKACEIADQGYSYIVNQIRPGMTEKEVENRLLYYMKSIGAQKESFDIIVASGPNGAKPHAKAGQRIIQQGDFVTMDFGARFEEYCSDLTRTVAVGSAQSVLYQIYEIVRIAQETAIHAIRPGKRCREIDSCARSVIEKAGYGKEFTHNLGHGIGIACHESPDFSGMDDTILEPGMVLTVEPGIYVEGIGGVRIEDDILVTASGCEILTRSPKELTIVGI